MQISQSISRLSDYYKRNGLAATLRRAGLSVKRALFAGRMIVFYCDLDGRNAGPVKMPPAVAVQRIRDLRELPMDHFQQITSIWNANLARKNIRERFDKQASLWLVLSEGQLAGFVWTLTGQTIEPYYFPLGPKDVHFFDFYVFPRFRGRGLNWLLTRNVLNVLAAEGMSRAFDDTAEWNLAQLASLKMTPFRPLGAVRKFTLFRRVFAFWSPRVPLQKPRKTLDEAQQPAIVLRSNE